MTQPNPYGFPPVRRLSPVTAQIDPAAVRSHPRPPQEGDRVVLLLHGLGSHEEDLLGLAPALPDDYVYVSLRGVFGCGPGYAWLNPPPLDPADRDLLSESATALEQWIAQECPGTVAGMIGFSQGAILALELLRRDAEAAAWVVQLSGAPFPAPLPGDAILAGRDLPAFWGHGGQDPLFDATKETAIREWMSQHTQLTEERSPLLGHGVDQQVLEAVDRFIRSQR